MEKPVREVVQLEDRSWDIVVDLVPTQEAAADEEIVINYPQIDDLDETEEGFLLIETAEEPGDVIRIEVVKFAQ